MYHVDFGFRRFRLNQIIVIHEFLKKNSTQSNHIPEERLISIIYLKYIIYYFRALSSIFDHPLNINLWFNSKFNSFSHFVPRSVWRLLIKNCQIWFWSDFKIQSLVHQSPVEEKMFQQISNRQKVREYQLLILMKYWSERLKFVCQISYSFYSFSRRISFQTIGDQRIECFIPYLNCAVFRPSKLELVLDSYLMVQARSLV